LLCGDLHEFLLHACLPFVSACPSPPCYYSFARRGRASGWWRRWICLLCFAPPPWPPRWRAPASCSFRALLFRFVPFLRGSFPPSPSWSPPPGTPRGTPARSKRRDRDARGRWFAFPFRSSLAAVHDDREQSAAKTDGSRRRRRGRAHGTGGISLWGHPRGTIELVGSMSIDIGTLCWLATRTERQGRDGCCRPSATATVLRLWGGAAFSFGKFVDFYLYIKKHDRRTYTTSLPFPVVPSRIP
jgi:hypothetical protein